MNDATFLLYAKLFKLYGYLQNAIKRKQVNDIIQNEQTE